MFDIHPVRLIMMVVFAVPALLLALVPLATSLIALTDITHWTAYIPAYVGSTVLACGLTGPVYVARGFNV